MPAIRIATMNNAVATGRIMKGREGFIYCLSYSGDRIYVNESQG